MLTQVWPSAEQVCLEFSVVKKANIHCRRTRLTLEGTISLNTSQAALGNPANLAASERMTAGRLGDLAGTFATCTSQLRY